MSDGQLLTVSDSILLYGIGYSQCQVVSCWLCLLLHYSMVLVTPSASWSAVDCVCFYTTLYRENDNDIQRKKETIHFILNSKVLPHWSIDIITINIYRKWIKKYVSIYIHNKKWYHLNKNMNFPVFFSPEKRKSCVHKKMDF